MGLGRQVARCKHGVLSSLFVWSHFFEYSSCLETGVATENLRFNVESNLEKLGIRTTSGFTAVRWRQTQCVRIFVRDWMGVVSPYWSYCFFWTFEGDLYFLCHIFWNSGFDVRFNHIVFANYVGFMLIFWWFPRPPPKNTTQNSKTWHHRPKTWHHRSKNRAPRNFKIQPPKNRTRTLTNTTRALTNPAPILCLLGISSKSELVRLLTLCWSMCAPEIS